MFIKCFLFHTSFITIFFSVISLTAAQINPEIPKVGEKAPFFEFENFSSKKIVEKKNLIIVFYRGHFWGICRSQLGELQQFHQKFLERNTEIVAISMDNLENAKAMAEVTGAQFQVLYDHEVMVVRRFGVYNILGDGVAAPSAFVIGKKRSLEWSYIGKNAGDRPSIDDLLSKLD